ncbi:MAG: PSD1 and planctomycete cytochrome C domain-containing protein [Pirellulaceae bacterium]
MLFRCACILTLLLHAGAVRGADSPDYARDVLPILSQHCFACHGPDAEVREAGLRLDVPEDAVRELDSGSIAVVPGSAEDSELIARIFSDDEFMQMPPPETGKSLSATEKEILARWIDGGATYSAHWSFQPVARPEAPAVRNKQWVRGEIDAFVLAGLEAEGLRPSPSAAPQTLIRRLYLDLTGLPPSIKEVQAFAADSSEEAYEAIVDQLLASEHFGERWGRHWLDLARFADSHGYLGDELRPDAWRYRDWVISAINADMPYDQFTIEQLAGDLLPDAEPSQRIATGFHRNAMQNTEAGFDKEEDRVIQTVDRLATAGTIWMGLTIACAECHTHKYDPLTHHEFYQLYAFFNNVEADNVVVGYQPGKSEAAEVRDKREQRLEKLVENLQQGDELLNPAQADLRDQFLVTLATPEKSRTESEKEALEHWLADLPDSLRKLLKEYETLAQQRPQPKKLVAPAIQERGKLRSTHVHYRGDFRQPTDEVVPGTPRFLPPLSSRGKMADRLDLARWLVDPGHPLTSRTAVNHLWQHLFLEGLFRTEENLGVAGEPPTHPQLLDWLASELVENHWSRKALIKTIVLSATYRQSSQVTDQLRQRDPENRLLGRQFRYRLEGEIIRDLALSASGLLNDNVGGPSIRPPMNKRLTSISRNQDWDVSKGSEQYRRGLYILFRRATPFPMLTTFDSPDATTSCPSREISNSPLQSLTLLNDPVFFECAQHLGHEVSQAAAGPEEEWIAAAFHRTLSRAPTDEELQLAKIYYQAQKRELENSAATDADAIVLKPVAGIEAADQAARVLLVRGLMNLDEFITRE